MAEPRIGLVLGGGGVVGVAWELGVLAALGAHSGWSPASATVITGTSAGSMVGALTALGRDLDETVILDRASGLDLTSAVAASCAVPTYFPPVEHQGRHFTDGPRAPYIADLVAELGLGAAALIGRLDGERAADRVRATIAAATG
jgi:predicted acylesterase/phospholipase RssA